MNFSQKILRQTLPKHLVFFRTFIKKVLFRNLNRKSQVLIHWNTVNKNRRVFTSPWAPSNGDIFLYKKYIQSLARIPKRVLVLGGTPALRRLLFSLSLFPVVIDQSSITLQYTSRLLGKNIVGKERHFKSDWRHIPFPDGFFDLIIGDLVLFQFLPEEQNLFLSSIKKHIAPKGVFITRIHHVSPRVYEKEVSHIIQDIISKGGDENKIASRLMAILFDRCGEIQSGKTNRAAAIKALKNYSPRSGAENDIIEETIFDWNQAFLDYALQYKEEILEKLALYFSKIEADFADDYEESNSYPIYFLNN